MKILKTHVANGQWWKVKLETFRSSKDCEAHPICHQVLLEVLCFLTSPASPPPKNNKQEHSPQNNGVCNDKRKIVLICFNLIQCKVYLEVIRVLLPGCLASLLPTQTDNFALLDAVYYRSLQKTNESSKTIS